MSGRLIVGNDPKSVASAVTIQTGRMKPLPEWASGRGAIIGTEGGGDAVRSTLAALKEANVP